MWILNLRILWLSNGGNCRESIRRDLSSDVLESQEKRGTAKERYGCRSSELLARRRCLDCDFLSQCFAKHLTTINIENSHYNYTDIIMEKQFFSALLSYSTSSVPAPYKNIQNNRFSSTHNCNPNLLFYLCIAFSARFLTFPQLWPKDVYISYTCSRESCIYYLKLIKKMRLGSQSASQRKKTPSQHHSNPDLCSPNPLSSLHDDQNWRFPNLILQQLNIMSLNSSTKPPVPNELSTYNIDLTLPFKVCTTPSRKTSKYERDGHWNQKQRLKYAIFLSYFQDLFLDPLKKKSIKIYDMMADMIITRNSNQCRSHHQKMEKYRSSVPEIINSVAQKYQPRVYKELEGKYLLLIKVLLENKEKYIRAAPLQERNKGNGDKSVVIRMEEMEEVKESQVKVDVRSAMEKYEVESLVVVKEDKEKNVKTTDTYLEEKGDGEEQLSFQEIPIMTLSDPKIEQESQKAQNEANDPLVFSFKQPQQDQNLFSFQKGLQLTLQGITYYQQQIKMLQLKKQWHDHNLQQLSAQLLSEKQSIKLCDSSIKLYQMAINSSIK